MWDSGLHSQEKQFLPVLKRSLLGCVPAPGPSWMLVSAAAGTQALTKHAAIRASSVIWINMTFPATSAKVTTASPTTTAQAQLGPSLA